MKYYIHLKSHGFIEVSGFEFKQDVIPFNLFCHRLGKLVDGKYVPIEKHGKQWLISEASTGGKIVDMIKTKKDCKAAFDGFIAQMKEKHGHDWLKFIVAAIKENKKRHGLTPAFKTNQIDAFEEDL